MKKDNLTSVLEQTKEELDIQMPEVTLCPHITYCILKATKGCLFNEGYKDCQTYKFYNKLVEATQMGFLI